MTKLEFLGQYKEVKTDRTDQRALRYRVDRDPIILYFQYLCDLFRILRISDFFICLLRKNMVCLLFSL